MKENTLDELREEIRDLDSQLLGLVAKRMDLARKVGHHKKQNKLPIKNYKVEKAIMERAEKAAKELGIYSALARSILSTLIEYSVLEQDEIRQKNYLPATDTQEKILIVGGAGNMGNWFAQFFNSMGIEVSIFDPVDKEKIWPEVSSLDSEQVNRFQYLLLATPMEVSRTIIEQLALEQVKPIIIEIGSLKEPIINTYKKARSLGLKIVSIHPMFGPSQEFLSGKNILFCKSEHEDENKELEELREFFSLTSANIIELSLEDHDRYMSYILGASHFINLIYASLLSKAPFRLSELEKLAGTTFSKQLSVTKDVVNENQDLYFEIQISNPETSQLLKDFEKTLSELAGAISKGNREIFKKQMAVALKYFSVEK